MSAGGSPVHAFKRYGCTYYSLAILLQLIKVNILYVNYVADLAFMRNKIIFDIYNRN